MQEMAARVSAAPTLFTASGWQGNRFKLPFRELTPAKAPVALTSDKGKLGSIFCLSHYIQAHLVGRIRKEGGKEGGTEKSRERGRDRDREKRHLSKGQHSTDASGTVNGNLIPN